MAKDISDLPHALAQSDELTRLLDVRRPAVFLDYDGTLTPIVDRPEDAVISHGMRRTVRELAGRCRVCVVSGRDRRLVQELMGLDNLIVAGSHGFDIWSPEGTVEREEGAEFEALLDGVKRRLHEELDPIEGALVELKRISIAAHYRLVSDEDAFETLAERGVGIFVGSPDDPEVAGRTTAADYILLSTEEVRQFLDTLAR